MSDFERNMQLQSRAFKCSRRCVYLRITTYEIYAEISCRNITAIHTEILCADQQNNFRSNFQLPQLICDNKHSRLSRVIWHYCCCKVWVNLDCRRICVYSDTSGFVMLSANPISRSSQQRHRQLCMLFSLKWLSACNTSCSRPSSMATEGDRHWLTQALLYLD